MTPDEKIKPSFIGKMVRRSRKILGMAGAGVIACGIGSAQAMTLPAPAQDVPLAAHATEQTIVLAGGCFWGVQAVFQHLKGVRAAVSGYAGGTAETAKYDIVSGGNTGHAESVQVTYDASQITLGKILQVFFSVAHNPTELNYQGPDQGTQYRSAIFYATPGQKDIAEKYIAQLNAAKVFANPIVTKLEALGPFYPAEAYHQNYARENPYNPYIMINDAPKVRALAAEFPDLFIKP